MRFSAIRYVHVNVMLVRTRVLQYANVCSTHILGLLTVGEILHVNL